MTRHVVCIDAGHGGRDSGAVGGSGTLEKDVTLAVALEMREILSAVGVSVAMTRDGDDYVTLRARAGVSNAARADAFISIHANAGRGRGHEVYTSPGETDADALATDCFKHYSSMFPHMPSRADYGDGDADKEARFAVLMQTDAPAILYELAFIDTPEGELFLTDGINQRRMAAALADGVLEFLGLLGADAGMPTETWESELEARVARLEQRIEAMVEALTA